MNIFVMVLVAIFVAGYYVLTAPNTRTPEQETLYAIERSDLRSVAECTTAVHNAKLHGETFDDICVQQNNIISQTICLNKSSKIIPCDSTKTPVLNYVITTTNVLPESKFNAMTEILEQYYSNIGTFGILTNKNIVSGGMQSKYSVPNTIVSNLKLQDGQLIYITQYAVPIKKTVSITPTQQSIDCPNGTVKTYRFGRWQCIATNDKTTCGGDMVWNSELLECMPDETRKPLCANNQTAVMIDDIWNCIDPIPENACSDNQVLQMNYDTNTWECIPSPTETNISTKCSNIKSNDYYIKIGTTTRVPISSCTDCEKHILDTNTCKSYCIPDPTKIGTPGCYADAKKCTGPRHGFYFGFPNAEYITHIPDIEKKYVPIDAHHSQNRKFNCLDCGDGTIDTEKSFPPYIAICK